MCERKRSVLSLLVILIGVLLLALAATPTTAYADEPLQLPDQGHCLNCHEDLYFLHDTGKWFCLREAPMACVDCHGGDPAAITQEKAHAQRAAHPVINENIAKCQECHPAQGAERVQIFKAVAGLKPVTVAVAYVPLAAVAEAPILPVTGVEQASTGLLWQETFTIIILISLVLSVVLLSTRRHSKGA